MPYRHAPHGAASVFLQETLRAVAAALGANESAFARACRNGLVLSVDNGHAVHPAHPEKSDPQYRVTLNGGIVVKHHANYATDGRSAALVKAVLQDNDIAYQDYYNRTTFVAAALWG